MSPRDNQRGRVYAAERAAANQHGIFWSQTISNDALQGWVNTVLDKRPIRSRWGNRHIDVVLKRGGRALAWGKSRITLPLGGRNEWVMLHEIAHCLTPGQYAPHGPEFAGVYLFLVQTVLGPEKAATLRQAFKEERVRTNRKGIPAVRSVVPPAQEPARKAAARERVKREKAQIAAAKAMTKAPLTWAERKQTAALLRRAATSGLFGPSTAKPRVHALATARALEKI